MKKNATALVIAGSTMLFVALLSGLLPDWLHMTGGRRLVLRIGLLVFGLIAAGLVYLYMAARAKARAPQPADAGDTTHQAIMAAEAQLARSAAAKDGRIGRLPLVLVLGPAGSTKTSIVTHSGLDAELLAGEVFRAEVTVPTEPVNVWLAQRTVFLEAGGALLEDTNRWARLVRHLQPRRLAAAIGRGPQASRVAVVCFPCDEFLKPGAGESVTAAARKLRARLGEISQQLGIRLPVYVIFTRTDRLPYFTDYVRSLSQSEAQQVLGATLPINPDTSGAWAERESQRLNTAFGRMVHALSLRRLEVLTREAGDDVRAGAYEFPRELRKVSELAVQFLIEVARPSQLGTNPFLRGFYFTGVRPVIKADVALESLRATAPNALAAGATSVFDARVLQQAMAATPRAGGRKVPEWVFLHRLFREVILVDDVAFKLTGGGTRVDLLRRGLIGAAAAASVLLALGVTVSFASNSGMVRRAQRSVTAAGAVGGVPGTVSASDLEQLDSLRALNAQIRSYERAGRPLRYRFGLYAGDNVQEKLRAVYFERFALAMWNPTRDRLLRYLRSLPDRPNEDSDFGRAQDALAAHLITTNEYRRSTSDLLAPVLLNFWGAAEQEPAEAVAQRRTLAQRQFDYFATELPFGNPYREGPDNNLVAHTQSFLRAFGRQAYYRALVYSVSSKLAPVRYVGAPNVVRNDAVVPGAFTQTGYKAVLASLDSVGVVFERYRWIYGDTPPADKPTKAELLETYESDYVMRWQQFLAQSEVAAFTTPADAVLKLRQLSQPTSPLLALLETAAKETKMDSLSRITKAFQPVLVTTPPDQSTPSPEVLLYTQALGNLLGALSGLQAAGGAEPAAIGQASGAAAGVNNAVLSLAAKFNMASEARVTAAHVTRLLQRPSDLANTLVKGIPAADLNGAAADFCRASYAGIAGRYPFNPNTQNNADPVKVAEVFAKEDGTLWQFYEAKLQTYISPQGTPLPGQAVRPAFSSFMRRANEFTSAMFREGPVSLYFTFQPQVPANAQVILEVDGDRKVFTQNRRGSQGFVWQSDRGQEAKLTVMYGNTPVAVASGPAPWALFRLFQTARWVPGTTYTVEWTIPGRNANLTADISFQSGVPNVLRAGYFQPLQSCQTTVIN